MRTKCLEQQKTVLTVWWKNVQHAAVLELLSKVERLCKTKDIHVERF